MKTVAPVPFPEKKLNPRKDLHERRAGRRPLLARVGVLMVSGFLALTSSMEAQIVLGTAEDFAVLGGSTVTNTGPTNITGDVGVSPGSAITGFPPGTVIGTFHAADAVAAQAQADSFLAFGQLAAEMVPVGNNLTGGILGVGTSGTLLPGVYRFDAGASLIGTLNLDTQGDPNAVFHFQIGSTLITASNSEILLLNGGTSNIFWQVGSSATLGSGSTFLGTIIALTSITLTTGATMEGRALALNGAVTLDSNTIILPPTPGRFWTGDANNLWSGANWAPLADGANSSVLAPGADVVFSATGVAPQNQSTIVDVDATISSLTVNDPAAVTISGPGLLSIVGGGAVTGVTINEGAGLTTINAGLALSGTAPAITVHNAAGLVINGGVLGLDGLIKAGAGTLVLAGANAYTGNTAVVQGTLAVDGSVVGDMVVAGGALRGVGAIGGSVANHALVQPGGATSPGELTVGGDYRQSTTGALSIRLASTSDYDLLTVAGSAFLSGALNVSYLGSFEPVVGDVFTILTADQGVSGRFDSFNDANFNGTLLGLEVVYEDNAVLLRFVQGSFADLAETHNQMQVAQALDQLAAGEPGSDLIRELNTRQLSEIPGALSLLSAEDLGAIFTVGLSISEIQVGNLERRLGEVRQGSMGFSDSGFAVADSHGAQNFDGKSTMALDGKTSIGLEGKNVREVVHLAAEHDPRWGFFISGAGEFGDLESSTDARGANFTTGGVTFGGDYRVNRHLVVGSAIGYANTSTDLSRGGDLDFNSGKGSLYATLYGGGFWLNGIVGGGYGSVDTKRRTVGGFARGETNTTDFNALLGAGYDIHHGAFTWGPVASIQYTTVGIDGFRERGALGALWIDGQSQDSLKSAVGLKASYGQRLGRVVVTPEVRVQWQHEFLDDASTISSGFSSGSLFTVQGPRIDRDALLLDVGASVQLTDHLALFGFYTGELGRDQYTVHSVNVGVRVAF